VKKTKTPAAKKKIAAKKKTASPKTAGATERKKAAKKKAAPRKAAAKTAAKRKTTKKTVAEKKTAPRKAAAGATAKKKAARKTTAGKRGKAGRLKSPAPSAAELHPPFELEDMAQEAKFLIGKPEQRDESWLEAAPELPEAYGEDCLVLLPRDPYWAHVYWELTDATVNRGYEALQGEGAFGQPVLRVRPVGQKAYDIEIDFRSRRYNLKLGRPGAVFQIEIGLLGPGRRFVSLALSNSVTMPVDGPSDLVDEEWMTTDEEFENFYRLSAGPGQALTKEGGAGGSFAAGSFSAPRAPSPAPWLSAEVVLYGATQPGGRVTLGNNPVEVRPDGTFSVRLAFPEGRHTLPVTFHSASGRVIKKLAPEITRKNRQEEVTP